MKLIIDIDENVYTRLFDNGMQDNEISTDDICEMARALRLGTPIPDNATNGQAIQTLFKPNRVERTDDDVIVENYDFSKEWWNAPYQKGGKE